jgi:hypothetical protein
VNAALDALRIAVMMIGATSAALLVVHIMLCLLVVVVTVATMIALYEHTH